VVRPMIRARTGRIVAIGSVIGQFASQGNAAYGATKAALLAYVRTLAIESARRGVTVNYVAPGRWCLRCTGLVTPRRLAFESLTGPERKRKIALGYSDDLLIKQPAVMDLNMRAASAGVMVLRHLLQPFLRAPLPVTLAENLVTYNMKPVAVARNRNETCDICQANAHSGFGDCGEPVGLVSDIAAALLDENEQSLLN